MKRMNTFESMLAVANEVARCTRPDDWAQRPLQTASATIEPALRLLMTPLERLNTDSPEASMHRAALIHVLTAGLWNMCGRPVITLGHSTLAAIASTQLNTEAAELITPPWPAFGVRLPTPLLSVTTADNEQAPATLLIVAALPRAMVADTVRASVAHVAEPEDGHRWWYKLCSNVSPRHAHLVEFASEQLSPLGGWGLGTTLWGFNMTNAELLAGRPNDSDERPGWDLWDQLALSTSDERVDMLTRSLVLNICQYVQRPNAPQAPSQAPVTTRSRRNGSYTEHHIRVDLGGVDLNLIEGVRHYLDHGRFPALYQQWVAPHWKRVAYGDNRALRRLQYIQPYKRGYRA